MNNKVKFKIGEIEFEAEGSSEVVERERNVFLNSLLPAAVDAIVRTRGSEKTIRYIAEEEPTALLEEKCESPAVAISDVAVEVDWERTSLSSFIGKYGNVADKDFVLLAAYYEENKNGNKTFTSEKVKQWYSDSRRGKYSNYSDLLNKLAQKGLIMDDPNAEKKYPKSYILTAEGLLYAQNFQPSKEQEKKQSKPRKNRSKIKSEYEGINVDALNIQNYPDIKTMHDFKEKMMMVLYIITNEKVGEWFTTSDVLYLLTDVFGEPATKDQVNGVFKREKLWFKTEDVEGNKNIKKRKLLNQGVAFAKELMHCED